MPKVVDHDAYRAELVQHALRLFVERGYAGVGMRELAAASGVSKSALYHYFDSKDALFGAVVDHVAEADAAAIRLQITPGATFAQRRAAFIDFVLAQETWFQWQFSILADVARLGVRVEPPAGAAAPHPYVSGIAALLEISLDEASSLYFELTGVLLQRWVDGGATDLDTALRFTLDRLSVADGRTTEESL